MVGPLKQPYQKAAVIVAHPDDETLWCGGFILQHPDWQWTILTLCRASDPDRAPRFEALLHSLQARGVMADLDDGPEQKPLLLEDVKHTLTGMLPPDRFDLVLTHGPRGEYTRHLRHEECCEAVVQLWDERIVHTPRLWMFAYEDGEKSYLPRPRTDAHFVQPLSEEIWRMKQRLLTGIYGFPEDSWERRVCPRVEAFFCFQEPSQAKQNLTKLKAAL